MRLPTSPISFSFIPQLVVILSLQAVPLSPFPLDKFDPSKLGMGFQLQGNPKTSLLLGPGQLPGRS